jgi:hypothetical protein
VGPGQKFDRIEDAVAAAKPGDTVLVHPAKGGTYDKVALMIKTPKLTLRAAGKERVHLRGDGFDYSGSGRVPRAIVQFNPNADGCTLEGFELSGAHNGSYNGAGVRINQANDVTIRNCDIHDNDMGIMSNGDGTPRTGENQLIEHCAIHANGNAKDPGYNHNLYLGGTKATLIGCEVFGSLTGHNVKSRAHVTIVLGCYVHDSANREFDLVDAVDTAAPGSDAAIVGCVIAKDPRCTGNRAVIHYGQDGNKGHNGTIWLANNTILTPFLSPVLTLDTPDVKSQWLNNILTDPTGVQGRQVLVEAPKAQDLADVAKGENNWLSGAFADPGLAGTVRARHGEGPAFMNAAAGDYRLKTPPPIDGKPLPAELKKLIGEKLWQYQSPASAKARDDAAKPSLGAVEAGRK